MELCTLIFNGALICLQEEKTILNTKWKELVYAYTRIYHSQNTPYRSITGQYSGKWLTKTIFEFRGEGFRVDNIEYWVLKILALLYSFHYFELNTQYASLKARCRIQYSIFNIWPITRMHYQGLKGHKVWDKEGWLSNSILHTQYLAPCPAPKPLITIQYLGV